MSFGYHFPFLPSVRKYQAKHAACFRRDHPPPLARLLPLRPSLSAPVCLTTQPNQVRRYPAMPVLRLLPASPSACTSLPISNRRGAARREDCHEESPPSS